MRADLDTLESLIQCGSADELSRTVGERAKDLGFEYWVYGLVLPVTPTRVGQFILSGYPSNWMQHYVERDYQQIDPITQHCRAHMTPLTWNPELLAHGDTPQMRDNSSRFFSEASEFGIVSGVSAPIHGLGCQWGVLSLASASEYDAKQLKPVTPHVFMLACYMHEIGHKFALEANASGQEQRLTTREIECLSWASEGKTSWEIGRLLTISERTVVFHLRNASMKLGVFNRQQAIARAIVLGYLQP